MWFMRDFVVRALLWALHTFMTEKEKDMMSMLFAQRVILGKTEFAAVPAKLKAQVAVILPARAGAGGIRRDDGGGGLKPSLGRIADATVFK